MSGHINGRHIALAGMMGSGKSTVGPLVASRLGCRFVDLDQAVEAEAGHPIPRLFADEGEAGFRRREVATLRRLLSLAEPTVVALGGGTVETEEARELLTGDRVWVVWLDAPPAVLAERVRSGPERPLLASDPVRRLEDLWERRRPLYRQVHHLRLAADLLSPEALAAAIVEAYQQGGVPPVPRQAIVAAPRVSSLVVRRTQSFRWRDWIDLQAAPGLVVADPAVAEYAQGVVEELREQGAQAGWYPLAIGEAEKSPETLVQLWHAFVEHRLTRDSWVIAVGGGVLTDTVGFAAATYLRGLAWAAVPTTVLAQVDAAIGGKVAVNLPEGKNLVGAFHLPALVVLDRRPLATLPPHEWRAGLGEVVKSALIDGGWLWERLCRGVPPLGSEAPEWEEILYQTAAVKVRVVNQDPFERHQRMYLNFGHTLAHALEQLSGYGHLSHGEAVGLGSLAALYLSERVLGLDPAVRTTVAEWLKTWGAPTRLPRLSLAALEPVLMRDKKARGFGLQWILLQAVGRPQVVRGVSWTLVEEMLQALS
ncbi:MAG: bifunctional shikimate kinase/3-dehydroquinate synthase [Firmicutes bacterium]|nr:bifunctional shikimate kinase/3-dehydroquinate synthase [Bacillota bacterium]